MIAFRVILNFTPISRKSLNYLNVGIEIKIVLNLCGLFLPPLFSSLDNSFYSLAAKGLEGAKIQFSDFSGFPLQFYLPSCYFTPWE